MKVKIEIKSIFGKVLFSFEKENNTLKDTISEANLRGANLYEANLYEANLYKANLRGADLREANLREANLYEANLREANLREADLYGADLRGADLRGADLYGADLREADLRGADLYGANLYEANLREADLYEANLYKANLREADLCGAKNSELVIAQTRILPEGDLIGYKKCSGGIIVKLRIPEAAKRSHSFGRKCRSEYAEVLEIFGANMARSTHNNSFVYKVGETVKPVDPFSEEWTEECASGIHFFITKIEAENY